MCCKADIFSCCCFNAAMQEWASGHMMLNPHCAIFVPCGFPSLDLCFIMWELLSQSSEGIHWSFMWSTIILIVHQVHQVIKSIKWVHHCPSSECYSLYPYCSLLGDTTFKLTQFEYQKDAFIIRIPQNSIWDHLRFLLVHIVFCTVSNKDARSWRCPVNLLLVLGGVHDPISSCIVSLRQFFSAKLINK